MSRVFDLIVVGAGPGGATAAYHLAAAGLNTLLLEKERLPRYKPCGGGVTTKVQRLLDLDLSPAIEDTIGYLSVGDGAKRVRYAASVGWCTMRPAFDALLVERVARGGGEVRDGEAVRSLTVTDRDVVVSTRGETLHASLVVGADGVNGIVRRAAGIPPHGRIGAALEAELAVTPAALEEWRGVLHLDFGAIDWGYGWIFPKADHLSVGIGALVRAGRRLDLRAALNRYVTSEPTLRHATEILSRGHRIPIGGRAGRYHAPRIVLVGDAAGLVDPFTAEGIYYAIRSGQIAAEEIGRAFGRGDTHIGPYTRRINAEINADFRYAWLMTQALCRWPHLSYDLFTHSASMQDAAARILRGDTTYRQLFAGLVRKLAHALLAPGSAS